VGILKRFAWFLLRSPQRSMVGWQTLWTDLEGLISVLLPGFKPKSNNTIWVCVANKNRSEHLLKYLVHSLASNPRKDLFGLSVVDCMSSDNPNLESDIKTIWKGPMVFSQKEMDFSRSKAFNMAIDQAPGELAFVCDADISLPENIAQKIYKNTTEKTAWFPVCQWQLAAENNDWKWFTAGTGIFSAYKKQLQRAGMFNENIQSWGKEDWDLFFRFYKCGIMPFRSRCKGLYHHWHTSNKPENYENMF
jgi:glycosyltransferase involved in cell wall biosynthesis